MIIDHASETELLLVGNFHMNDAGKPEMKELMGIFIQIGDQEIDITTSVLPNLQAMNMVEAALNSECSKAMKRLSPENLVKLGFKRRFW